MITRETVNIYCDESCHLQNDGEAVMAIGAVYYPASKKKIKEYETYKKAKTA